MQNRFRRYIFIQGLAVGLVLILFKAVGDKKVASVAASSAFLFASLAIVLIESKKHDFNKSNF